MLEGLVEELIFKHQGYDAAPMGLGGVTHGPMGSPTPLPGAVGATGHSSTPSTGGVEWKQILSLLQGGSLDEAFSTVLEKRDDLLLIKLIGRTGK